MTATLQREHWNGQPTYLGDLFTRLTNGFSKKAQNHAHAVARHFMH